MELKKKPFSFHNKIAEQGVSLALVEIHVLLIVLTNNNIVKLLH
jgi:hypothetical protein